MKRDVRLSPMPALELPPRVIEFLELPNPAVIACIRPDGFPMTVATWYDWEDGRILVNMHESRSRLRWMRDNPKVSITVLGDDWYRHVSLFGSVATITEDVALRDIDRLCLRYTGKAFANRFARRVSAWIQPSGWHGWDDEGELSSPPIA
ncbi:MAG TPA: pyridoxamine 5'-phosphate oxidase family protein [Clostridia bacterium]|nr:pyridoxamine 5'-phosphate oxidase family protein [Clostridia bacterium]